MKVCNETRGYVGVLTRCTECPSGWIAVADKQALSPDAVITDKTGCLGFGVHTFCCPGDQELPRCGMYGWFGGNCKVGFSIILFTQLC